MSTPRTFTISLPGELAADVDRLASKAGYTRSELVRAALRQYKERLDRWDQLFTYGRALAKEHGWTEDDVVEAVKEYRREQARLRAGSR